MRETDPYSLETQLRGRNIDPGSYSWFGADYSEYQRLEAGTSGAAPRVYGAQVTSPHGRGSGSDGTPVSEIWMTAALLNMLTQIPGVTVFHRLRAPGTWMRAGTVSAAHAFPSLRKPQPASRTKKIKDRNAVFSPLRMRGGRSSRGVSGDGSGSLTVATRYPADVKALIIA